MYIGIAAHVYAAAPGGLRYDGDMSNLERSSVGNGMWLRQSCAHLIDSDEARYTVDLLRRCRRLPEDAADLEVAGGSDARTENVDDTDIIRFYEKCGFVCEGVERDASLSGGDWQSDVLMSIL